MSENKLIAITINGQTKFVWMKPNKDGKYRISAADIVRLWNIPPHSCFAIG